MRKDRKYLRIGLRKAVEPEYARAKRYAEHLTGTEITDTAFAASLIEQALEVQKTVMERAIQTGRVPEHVVYPNHEGTPQ